jgi:hypothetical protein
MTEPINTEQEHQAGPTVLTDAELDYLSGGLHGDPTDPGCEGQIVKVSNGLSGEFGPSNSPN